MQRIRSGVLALAVVLSTPGLAAAGAKGNGPAPSQGTLIGLPVPPAPEGADVHNDAWEINDAGTIVGTAYWFLPLDGEDYLEQSLPVRWVDHELEILDGDVVTTLADGTEASGPLLYADPRGINHHGDIAGYVYTDGGENPGDYAAVWDDDDRVWRTLPLPEGASFAYARDINDAGHVAGNSSEGAWLWRGGEAELLPRLSPEGGCGVFAMNNHDMVTGACVGGDRRQHAVVWWLGQVHELATYGGTSNFGRAINDAGQIVGYAGVPGAPQGRPVTWSVWHPEVVRALGERGAANGINNAGLSVGYLGINDDLGTEPPRGVSWSRTGDLKELGSLGGFLFPRDINNSGSIIGSASDAEGHIIPFLLER